MKYSQAKRRIRLMKELGFKRVRNMDKSMFVAELYFDEKGEPIKSPFETGRYHEPFLKAFVKMYPERIFVEERPLVSIRNEVRQTEKEFQRQVREQAKRGGTNASQ